MDPLIQAPEADIYLSAAQRMGEGAMCFWMGDLDRIRELQVPLGVVRMPFKICWFEGEFESDDAGNRSVVGTLAVETPDADRAMEALVFMRHGRAWALMSGVCMYHDGSIGVTSDDGNVMDGARYAISAVKVFCCAINCTNVVRREHTPAVALQKARQKKGKAPLFSFWTLELTGRGEDGQVLGGTHASPRVHLVRGHPREYAVGKWTWVQAHARGNPVSGMVHKDYSAGPALLAAPQ